MLRAPDPTNTTEPNNGAYVNRVTRGYKRTFFQCSVPNEWLADLVSIEESIRAPEVVSRRLGHYLTDVLWPQSKG